MPPYACALSVLFIVSAASISTIMLNVYTRDLAMIERDRRAIERVVVDGRYDGNGSMAAVLTESGDGNGTKTGTEVVAVTNHTRARVAPRVSWNVYGRGDVLSGLSCNVSSNSVVSSVRLSAPTWSIWDVELLKSGFVWSAKGGYTIRILSDGAYDDFTAASCRVAVMSEPPVISPGMYRRFLDEGFTKRFDLVYTTDIGLLVRDRVKFRPMWVGQTTFLDVGRCLGGGCNVSLQVDSLLAGKRGKVSIIFSAKRSAPGHILRHVIWDLVKRKYGGLVEGFGAGVGRVIESKKTGLYPFLFSIVVENGKDQGLYFSEKVVDAILSLVVPIYWSDGGYITEVFDMRGFILFKDVADLDSVLLSLRSSRHMREVYRKKLPYLVENMKRAMDVRIMEDPFKNVMRELLDVGSGRLRCGGCGFPG